MEAQLLRAIVSYEKINDDRIIPETFVVNWVTEISHYCEELQFTHSNDGYGGTFGFETNKPVKDIDDDLGKLKKRTLALNKELTAQQAELAQDVFKGL
ncbi:MAG: hypothetical protein QF595_05870, partial [Dehalococcoidia bacterium]|nr:hypothetical protein [Dehalococcoidia bacterium]